MIPWKDQLKPAEIDAMAAYVATLSRDQAAQSQAAPGREQQGRDRAGSADAASQ